MVPVWPCKYIFLVFHGYCLTLGCRSGLLALKRLVVEYLVAVAIKGCCLLTICLEKENRFLARQKPKLLSPLGVVLILGFLVTCFGSYFYPGASLRSGISLTELPQTSDNIYFEIQRNFLHSFSICSLMAADTFLRDWVLAGDKGEQQMTKYLQEIRIKLRHLRVFSSPRKTGITITTRVSLKSCRRLRRGGIGISGAERWMRIMK